MYVILLTAHDTLDQMVEGLTGGADEYITKPFDWNLLKALDPSVPFMLSGGLTPQTVADAIRTVRPFGVDVSSGVESAPGVKDKRLIEAFMRNARAAG